MDMHEVAGLDFCAKITNSRDLERTHCQGEKRQGGGTDASAEEGQLSQGLSGSPGRRCSGRGAGGSQLPDTDPVSSFQAMGVRQTLCLPSLDHGAQQALHKYCSMNKWFILIASKVPGT